MASRLLLALFAFLLLGKLFFRPQLAQVKIWFDGLINALLIAIALVYSLQLVLWLSS